MGSHALVRGNPALKALDSRMAVLFIKQGEIMEVIRIIIWVAGAATALSFIILLGTIIFQGYKNSSKSRQRLLPIGVVIIVLLLGGYWFGVRPYYIRRDCSHLVGRAFSAELGAPVYTEDYSGAYQTCINEKGL